MTKWLSMLMAAVLLLPNIAFASEGGAHLMNFTATGLGIAAVAVFTIAYAVVIMEEHLHLRKSKPVIIAAGIIWVLVALAYNSVGDHTTAEEMIRHNLLEYAELFLFLLAAMTFINVLEERNVFKALRAWMISKGFSLRAIFWITGLLAFFISPIADNLTTALLMAAVVMAVGGSNRSFVVVACINIVVAANAGGAFSPFGDITTLMVWQKGVVSFFEFFDLFVPSLVNWLVPAAIMSLTVSKEKPQSTAENCAIKQGGVFVIFLFLATIATAVSMHSLLYLPPVLGMMTGLGALKLFGFYLKKKIDGPEMTMGDVGSKEKFDIFSILMRAEWDTLMFFYGVILCVGGLGALGYLALVSQIIYIDLGPTVANVLVGILSAVVDNIPVMFAVLTMNPEMAHGQWLLVTLTAGVGGSLLSIGSAAGVGLMGQARGVYTFGAHLKWLPAIALGYAASIAAHLWINASLF